MEATMEPQPRRIEPDEDPVCGMRVDPEVARARGLTLTHAGREYVFCGKGCLLEFRDDPATYLDPSHQPTM
jgi:YHS domain-containing protein